MLLSPSGLRLAEQLGRKEDEAKIRHRLGLSLWASGNLEEAQHQVCLLMFVLSAASEWWTPAMTREVEQVLSQFIIPQLLCVWTGS